MSFPWETKIRRIHFSIILIWLILAVLLPTIGILVVEVRNLYTQILLIKPSEISVVQVQGNFPILELKGVKWEITEGRKPTPTELMEAVKGR